MPHDDALNVRPDASTRCRRKYKTFERKFRAIRAVMPFHWRELWGRAQAFSMVHSSGC